MSSRSPARWMAPLALLAAIAAVGYVVSAATRDDEGKGSPSSKQEGKSTKTSTTGKTSTGARTTTTSSQRKSYTVKSGDTLGSIAERTGVTVPELQELNPGLDPQSLTVGERIRLRR